MTDKEKYTQKLMDAVGGIDDKYVFEAQNYTPKKRMPGYVAAIIAAAASMALIIGAAFPFMTAVLLKKGANTSEMNAADDKPPYQMSKSFSKAEADKYDDPPEPDGAALIWRDENGKYSFVSISESKAEKLIASIGEDGETPAEDDGISVWIRTQNGEYISPELKRSPGNVECAIFEYSPEIAISDKAAQMITDIINERG